MSNYFRDRLNRLVGAFGDDSETMQEALARVRAELRLCTAQLAQANAELLQTDIDLHELADINANLSDAIAGLPMVNAELQNSHDVLRKLRDARNEADNIIEDGFYPNSLTGYSGPIT